MNKTKLSAKLMVLIICIYLVNFTSNIQAQQAHVNLDFNPQKNSENLLPFMTNIISPEVGDDRMVTFRLKAPKASEVLLSGGPLLLALGDADKPLPFAKDSSGDWSITVGPVMPDIYVYKFIVDGVSVCDPNNTFTGFGDQPGYSMLIVHGEEPAYYDARNVPHGAIIRNIYHSKVTNGEREIYVYIPPQYDRTKTYPVLYLTGGSGELTANWAIDGRINFIADNLLADGKAVPMIIAMVNNQIIHRNSANHAERSYKLFEAELRQEVIPFIEKNYSAIKNRTGRALAGLSMGGRHTQFIGLKSLDLFSSFGILSAGDVNSETLSAEFLNDPEANNKVDYLFVGLGTHESTPGNRSEMLHLALVKHNINHEYYIGGNGAHDWGTWRHLMWKRFLPGLWRK